jgi:hypothetical protein
LTIRRWWPYHADAGYGVTVDVRVLDGQPLYYSQDDGADGELRVGERRTFTDGAYLMSPGSTTVDLEMGGGTIGVAGTVSPAGVLGTVVGKQGVYGEDGSLIGYVPIYDDIPNPAVSARLKLGQ